MTKRTTDREKTLVKAILGIGVFFALAVGIINMGHIDTTRKTCSETTIPGIVHEVGTLDADTTVPVNAFNLNNVVYR